FHHRRHRQALERPRTAGPTHERDRAATAAVARHANDRMIAAHRECRSELRTGLDRIDSKFAHARPAAVPRGMRAIDATKSGAARGADPQLVADDAERRPKIHITKVEWGERRYHAPRAERRAFERHHQPRAEPDLCAAATTAATIRTVQREVRVRR